jgi:hypothetical protein
VNAFSGERRRTFEENSGANDHGYKEEIMTPEIQQTSNHLLRVFKLR